jgi:hypothetical protein
MNSYRDATEMAIRELADGIAFWRRRQAWPADFHNADYERWDKENPQGIFSLEWWGPFLKTLQAWIATRPVSGSVLTSRFEEAVPSLSKAWLAACGPYTGADISTVTWEQVAAFPEVVSAIKPTLTPSPVFTSKFCHFLLPRVFPVVDNEGLGNRWPTYERYFCFVQAEWSTTSVEARERLTATLTSQIEATGQRVFMGFPMVNKIVELRLIGRRHPRTDSQS